jgi:hypothetical protein
MSYFRVYVFAIKKKKTFPRVCSPLKQFQSKHSTFGFISEYYYYYLLFSTCSSSLPLHSTPQLFRTRSLSIRVSHQKKLRDYGLTSGSRPPWPPIPFKGKLSPFKLSPTFWRSQVLPNFLQWQSRCVRTHTITIHSSSCLHRLILSQRTHSLPLLPLSCITRTPCLPSLSRRRSPSIQTSPSTQTNTSLTSSHLDLISLRISPCP